MGFALFSSPSLGVTNCMFITLLCGGRDAFKKRWIMRVKIYVIFVRKIGACFSLAQNSEHNPVRNYVTNYLIFN
jgi:hypothetical protein